MTAGDAFFRFADGVGLADIEQACNRPVVGIIGDVRRFPRIKSCTVQLCSWVLAILIQPNGVLAGQKGIALPFDLEFQPAAVLQGNGSAVLIPLVEGQLVGDIDPLIIRGSGSFLGNQDAGLIGAVSGFAAVLFQQRDHRHANRGIQLVAGRGNLLLNVVGSGKQGELAILQTEVG